MDPEPNEETKVSAPVSSSRQGAASDESAPGNEGLDGSDPSIVAEPSGDAPADGDGRDRDDGSRSSQNTPASRKRSKRSKPNAGTHPNNVRRLRQRAMMSKAELARRAGVSPLTIDRVESGCPCRMDTKRKILEALGIPPASAVEVFPDVDLG